MNVDSGWIGLAVIVVFAVVFFVQRRSHLSRV
jgi:hypothetical protein